jgi:hypothetical protein
MSGNTTISFNVKNITDSVIYKLVLAYVFVLEICASQQTEKSIFKNIFIRLFTTFLVFHALEFNIIKSLTYSLVFTTIAFALSEK